MAYQPWYRGQTYPAIQFPLNVEGNPDNITGVSTGNIKIILRNTSVAPPVDTTGTGTVAIITTNPALISYTFSPADVSQVFNGFLFIEVVFPGSSGPGTNQAIYDPVAFAITDD